MHEVINVIDSNYELENYEELEEKSICIPIEEEERPYFPPEESKPPHY